MGNSQFRTGPLGIERNIYINNLYKRIIDEMMPVYSKVLFVMAEEELGMLEKKNE